MIKKFFNFDGQEVTVEEQACAKQVKNNNGSERYFIKKAANGQLFDQNNLWHVPGTENAFDKRRGRNIYEFTQVNKECFEFYLKFLQTKNPAYLRNAEREKWTS